MRRSSFTVYVDGLSHTGENTLIPALFVSRSAIALQSHRERKVKHLFSQGDFLFMENPLDKPIPSDRTQQVELFTRQLAWAVMHENWQQPFYCSGGDWNNASEDAGFKRLLEKWKNSGPKEKKIKPPPAELLVSVGYMRFEGGKGYLLEPKAMNLIRSIGNVFISYSHEYSSAFALLIEARLRMVGVTVFVDKDISGGTKWKDELETNISQCQHFVCLVGGGNTLKSGGGVDNEITLATGGNCKLITVFHNKFFVDDARLKPFQYHKVRNDGDYETALDYEAAVNWIFFACGLPTYSIPVEEG